MQDSEEGGDRMTIYHKMLFGLFSISIVLIGGCSKQAFSPENVITKALDTDEDLSYYGELSGTFEGLEGLEDISMKEWRDGNFSRVEMDSSEGVTNVLTNNENVIIYNEEEKTVYYSEDDALQEVYMNPREQLDMVLDIVKDTHNTENVGEEEIAGRPAIHLKLIKREDEKSLFGNQELWVDKEHWIVLKMISESGNIRNEAYYDSIDFDVDHEPSVFELDLPDDVEKKDLDELSDEIVDETIDLDEISDKFGSGVLHFPDKDAYQLDDITYLEMEVEAKHQELTFEYSDKNTPLFTFTVLKPTEEALHEDDLGDAIERDEIRGQDAFVTDTKDFRSISWSEGEYDYSIMLTDPKLTWKQIKKWADDMENI